MSVSEYKVGLWVKGGEMGWGGEASGGWVRGVGGLQEPKDRGMGTGLGWDWGGWVWYTLFQKSDKFL